MTLEIPTELELQLERAARVRKMNVEDYVMQAVRDALEQSEIASLAAIQSLRGCLADSDFTVDDFLRERSEEAREEARREAGL